MWRLNLNVQIAYDLPQRLSRRIALRRSNGRSGEGIVKERKSVYEVSYGHQHKEFSKNNY